MADPVRCARRDRPPTLKEGHMQKRNIFVTEFDAHRLGRLVEEAREFSQEKEDHLADLERELAHATIITPQEVPPDVITMNSKVRLTNLDSGKEVTYTLVFPEVADAEQNAISVLAPIGTAMLGFRVGSEIEWKVPAGVRRFKVEEILYQPEAAGDFHL
jgi:regulator of nucleoside diphosphate kinase